MVLLSFSNDFGKKYGFLKSPKKPILTTVFSAKGGILKSTIVLNLARMYALHGIKTCVIDLDPQGDTSRNLGFDIPEENIEDISDIDSFKKGVNNLSDFYSNKCKLEDIINQTELPHLDVILSSSELIPFMEVLNSSVRREDWIKDHIKPKLIKLGYELIIIDLAPSWSIYTSNSITAADLLISPLECRIAHYRNHKESIIQLNKFIKKMGIKNIKKAFVPTKVSLTKKIYTQIRQFYAGNVEGCTLSSIRESIIGEESVAKRLSIVEYAPTKTIADDIRELLIELDGKIQAIG